MAVKLEITNLDGVLRYLSAQTDKTEAAALYAFGQVALAVEAQAKRNFDGVHRQNGVTAGGYPRWEPSGHIPSRSVMGHEVPNVRTGNLRRSIRTVVSPKGLGRYEATVEPGMIYARRVEVDYGYRFMRPARDIVAREANNIFLKSFRRKMGF